MVRPTDPTRPDDGDRLHRWTRATDTPLLVLAIGSLPILLLELERPNLPPADVLFLDAVNIVVLVAFALDYVVGLVLARDRRQYGRSRWANLLIVATQILALVPALTAFGVFRVLRGGPALRAAVALIRVAAVGSAARRDGRRILQRRAGSFAVGLAGLTWVSSAVAFTLAEGVGDDGQIDSFFDALWWATATITTVGYGDIYPVTPIGRLIGGVTMLVGISVFAVVTAKIAGLLLQDEPT